MTPDVRWSARSEWRVHRLQSQVNWRAASAPASPPPPAPPPAATYIGVALADISADEAESPERLKPPFGTDPLRVGSELMLT